MTDKMTLDELIKWLSQSRNECNLLGQRKQMQRVIDYIQANRTALEAGMRGTLRFVELRDERYGHNYYTYLHPDGKPDKSFRRHYKDFCEEFAKSLGRTAEFVEDDDG